MGGHRKPMKDYEYELDKSTGEVVKKYTHEQMVDKMLQNPEVLREYVRLINNGEFKKVKALDYSPEFTYWFERIYLQSPRMASLEYDDEKMWEAWKAAKELGVKNDLEL
jgi:hypothetical protein